MASEKKRKRTTKKMKIYKEEVSYKKSPRIDGPIKMKDVCSSPLLDDRKLVSDIMIMGVCKDVLQQVDHGSSSSSSSRSVVVRTNNNNNNDSFDIIKSMKQDEENAAWILSGQISEVKFMPTQNMRMIVFGNEYGNIGFWNMDHHIHIEDNDNNHHKKSDNGIYVYYPHSGFISGLSINPFSLCKIMSSCYNGYIRVLDVEHESFDLAYKSDELITSICSPYNDINSLFFGESNGDVTTLDLRSSKPTSSWSLHEDKVYTIDFNSQNTNIMATGSKDDTACIWDLRKLADSKPLKVIQHDHHVNSAYFSPSGIYLATTSKDDCIGIVNARNYDVECMLYHSNWTGRSISSIRGIWGWDDGHIMVANKGNKGVDIVSANEQKLLYTLKSSSINAIPCRLDAHPMIPGLLAGSTGGGRVHVWDT